MVKVIFYIREGTKIKEYRNFIFSSVVIEAVATAIIKKYKKGKLLQTADSYQCALHKDNIQGIDIYWWINDDERKTIDMKFSPNERYFKRGSMSFSIGEYTADKVKPDYYGTITTDPDNEEDLCLVLVPSNEGFDVSTGDPNFRVIYPKDRAQKRFVSEKFITFKINGPLKDYYYRMKSIYEQIPDCNEIYPDNQDYQWNDLVKRTKDVLCPVLEEYDVDLDICLIP